MCEARVVIQSEDGSELQTIEDVTTIVPENDRLKLIDLYGSQTTVEAVLKEVRLLDHTVVLTRIG